MIFNYIDSQTKNIRTKWRKTSDQKGDDYYQHDSTCFTHNAFTSAEMEPRRSERKSFKMTVTNYNFGGKKIVGPSADK